MKKSAETKVADEIRVTADQQTPIPPAVTHSEMGKAYNAVDRERRVSNVVRIAASLCAGMITNGTSIGELRNKADAIATTAASIAEACDSRTI